MYMDVSHDTKHAHEFSSDFIVTYAGFSMCIMQCDLIVSSGSMEGRGGRVPPPSSLQGQDFSIRTNSRKKVRGRELRA